MGGRSPRIGSDDDGSNNPGTTGETLVVTGVLGGEDLALLLSHRTQVLEAIEDLDLAETTQGDSVARLAEPQPDLEDGIQQIRSMDDRDLAARRFATNNRRFDLELGKSRQIAASGSRDRWTKFLIPNS